MADSVLYYLERRVNENQGMLMKEWAAKRLVWVSCKEEGFTAGRILKEDGDRVEVEILKSCEHRRLSKNEVHKMNPPKFEKCEDMSELACLNEACVYWNLRDRYSSGLIYTYSGLFCVVINPYKKLPIYSLDVMKYYEGKKKHDAPPHVYMIAEYAYRSMLEDREDQSILCTGESGAGKTENTKKVIEYLGQVGKGESEIERQLLEANPILEAFGNAKTLKNDNSSRFGKYIKINFDGGVIRGGSVMTYLLEKCRVVRQNVGERSFHIMYQLLSEIGGDYKYLNGDSKIVGVEDSEEYKRTLESFKVVGFSDNIVKSILETVEAVLVFGNILFSVERNSEQATLPDKSCAQRVCNLLGLNVGDLAQGLIRPRIKVGKDSVQKSQTKEQAELSVEAIGKATYEKLFNWIVMHLNKLLNKKHHSNQFIGILDIAGFEIFKINSFEQLCINYTNEKLQQLFNHRMFIIEQFEYKQEGINWDFIDFGLDLQPTIDLIERPIGVLGLLDEECLFPKATDKTLVDKLFTQLASHPNFYKQPRTNSDFTISHYAGRVEYYANNWLYTNMDPLSHSLVSLLQNSNIPFVRDIWKDPTWYVEKKGMFRTVSQLYKIQLCGLMDNLSSTTAHFIRCIIPNLEKKAGKVDCHLVLDQLRCNGVLEGIRICRQGFPNRVTYEDFRQRYSILVQTNVLNEFMDNRKGVEIMLQELEIDTVLYRLGKTKVFFRTGVLAHFEEERDLKIAELVISLQSKARQYLSKQYYSKRMHYKSSLIVIQRNCTNYIKLRQWSWFRLYSKLLPMVDTDRTIHEELSKAKTTLDKQSIILTDYLKSISELEQERDLLSHRLQEETDRSDNLHETVFILTGKKKEMEDLLQDMESRLLEEENNTTKYLEEKRVTTDNIAQLEQQLSHYEDVLQSDKYSADTKIASLSEQIVDKDYKIGKLEKEKQVIEDKLSNVQECWQSEEDRANNIVKHVKKLEGQLEQVNCQLERETQTKSDIQKNERRVCSELSEMRELNNEMKCQIDQLQTQIGLKNDNLLSLTVKCDEDSILLAKSIKENRDAYNTISQLNDDLDIIQRSKSSVEKDKRQLQHELDNLRMQHEETTDIGEAEKNLRREKEEKIDLLVKEIEVQRQKYDETVKQNSEKYINEINNNMLVIDGLRKNELNIKKCLKSMGDEMEVCKDNLRVTVNKKTESDNKRKQLEHQIMDMSIKMNDIDKERGDSIDNLNRLTNELERTVEHVEQLEKTVIAHERQVKELRQKLSEAESNLEYETCERKKITNQLVIKTSLVDKLNDKILEEEGNVEGQYRQLQQLQNKLTDITKRYDVLSAEKIVCDDTSRRLNKEIEALKCENDDLICDKTKLAKTASRLENELADSIIQLDNCAANIASLETKHKKFDNLLQDERNAKNCIIKDRDNIEQEFRNMETKYLCVCRELGDRDDQLQELNKKINSLTNELSIIESAATGETADKNMLRDEIKQLKRKNEEQNTLMAELEDEIYMLKNDLTRKDVAFQSDRTEWERINRERIDEFEDKLRLITKKNKDFEEMLDGEQRQRGLIASAKKKIESENREMNAIITDYESKNTDLTKHNKRLNNALKDALRDINDYKIVKEDWDSKLIEQQNKNKQLQTIIDEFNHNINTFQSQKKSLVDERDEYRDYYNDMSSKLSQSQQELANNKRTINSLRAELDDELNAREEYQDDLRKLKLQIDQTLTDLTTERTSTSKLADQLSFSDRQNRDLRSRIALLEEDFERSKVSGSSLVLLEQKNSKLEALLDSETRDRESALRTVRSLERKLRESNQNVEDERRCGESFKSQLEVMSSRNRTLKRNVEEADDEVNMLKSKMRKIQNERDELSETVDLLQRDVTQNKSRYDYTKYGSLSSSNTKSRSVKSDEED